MLHCILSAASAGDVLPLTPDTLRKAGMPHHRMAAGPLPALPVGAGLFTDDGKEWLRVTGRFWLPGETHAVPCPLLTALADIPVGEARLHVRKEGRSLAWITLSDKGSQGLRNDSSGPAIAAAVGEALPLCHAQGFLLADDAPSLRALLLELALGQGYDIICTSGGTGVGPRDITPQTVAPLLDLELPGFATAMMLESLKKTPHAAISRAVCGVLGPSIVITLPGSRKAVLENLAAVLPALPHALDKLHGDPADCGG